MKIVLFVFAAQFLAYAVFSQVSASSSSGSSRSGGGYSSGKAGSGSMNSGSSQGRSSGGYGQGSSEGSSYRIGITESYKSRSEGASSSSAFQTNRTNRSMGYTFIDGKLHYADFDGSVLPYSANPEKIEEAKAEAGPIVVFTGERKGDGHVPLAKTDTELQQFAENKPYVPPVSNPPAEFEPPVPLSPGFFNTVTDETFSYHKYYETKQDNVNDDLSIHYYQLMFRHLGMFCRIVQDELLKNRPESKEEILAMLQANRFCIDRQYLLRLLRYDMLFLR